MHDVEKMAEKCNSLKIEFLQMNPVSLITWVWTIYMHRSRNLYLVIVYFASPFMGMNIFSFELPPAQAKAMTCE